MRFAFAGDDFFLETYRLLDLRGHELIGAWVPERDNIYSGNERVTKFCEDLSAPVLGEKVQSAQVADLVDKGLDLLIVGMYPHKVPVEIVPKYYINMHPSLLPHGRGPCPIPCSILRGETTTGLSFHKITDRWDEGDIVLQKEFAIASNETHDSLSIKHMLAAMQLMDLFVSSIDEYWNNAKPQEGGEYWNKSEVDDRRIHWGMTAKEIDLRIRAFGRFGMVAQINEKDFEIKKAVCWEDEHGLEPGTLISGHNRDVAITCSNGFVCISG